MYGRWGGGDGVASRLVRDAPAGKAPRMSGTMSPRSARNGAGARRPPPAAEGTAGRLGPRRTLPTGRAVAGGFAVALAAVLVFGAYLGTRPERGHPWVVAAGPLAAGTTLSAADLSSASLQLPAPTARLAFPSVSALLGRTLAVPLAAGELVTPGELTATGAAPPLRPLPVTVSSADLVDLAPGERVDVLLTEGTAPRTRTTILLRGAEVMSTAQPAQGLAGAQETEVVTLGVATLTDVQAVVSAEHAGTVDLVVGEAADGTGLGGG
jgi:Flp pilus assembly protein CpaB